MQNAPASFVFRGRNARARTPASSAARDQGQSSRLRTQAATDGVVVNGLDLFENGGRLRRHCDRSRRQGISSTENTKPHVSLPRIHRRNIRADLLGDARQIAAHLAKRFQVQDALCHRLGGFQV